MSLESYLKKHTEAVVKEVGIEAACSLTGRSTATRGRCSSDSQDHDERFMPIDGVAHLDAASRFPHAASALSALHFITMTYDVTGRNASSAWVNQDVMALAQRFAQLMAEYNQAIGDGKLSVNEAKRMLRETLAIQEVILEMTLNLEEAISWSRSRSSDPLDLAGFLPGRRGDAASF